MTTAPPGISGPPGTVAVDRDLLIARRIVQLLDRSFLDPIIGLIAPAVGDLVTMIIGGYLVTIAVRRRVPAIVIARMLLNLGVDSAIGIIPLVGDIADFGIRANQKNLALIEDRVHHGNRATWRDWAAVIGATVLVLALFGLAIYGLIRLVGALV